MFIYVHVGGWFNITLIEHFLETSRSAVKVRSEVLMMGGFLQCTLMGPGPFTLW